MPLGHPGTEKADAGIHVVVKLTPQVDGSNAPLGSSATIWQWGDEGDQAAVKEQARAVHPGAHFEVRRKLHVPTMRSATLMS